MSDNNNINKGVHDSLLPKEGRGGSSKVGLGGLSKEDRGGYFYQQADPMLYGMLKDYARENRKNMTEAESILWRYIRKDALGVTFLRQYIIGEYIVDFACLRSHLIIEVDGGYHSEPRQQEDDIIRQQWLESQGFKVIRFTNEEIVGDIDKVVEKIRSTLKDLSPSLP